MAYKEMKEIYDRNRLDLFVMAVGHLLDIGFNNAKEITDDQIATIKDQGWATAGFLQKLVTISREITNACKSPVELIQFCSAEEVFDTEFYAPNKISGIRMREIAEKAVSCLCNEETIEDFVNETDLTDKEKDYFGVDYEEDDDYDE